MDRPTVLVISSTAQNELSGAVFDDGSIPIMTKELTGFVEKLQRNQVTAIVVDGEHTGTDALEVVLTARDIAPNVPILVLGISLDAATVSALQQHGPIRLLSKLESRFKLHHELARLTHAEDTGHAVPAGTGEV